MNFNYLVYLAVAIFLVFLVKKYLLFDNRNTRKVSAKIDYIKVGWLDESYSPDVELFFSFNVAGKIIKSSSFIQISEIIQTDFELTSRDGFPVLNIGDTDLVGEEHIENYLLNCRNSVMIEYNLKNVNENRIVDLDQVPIIESDQTDFPWKS